MKGNIRNINWKRIIYGLDEINKNLKFNIEGKKD